MLLHDHQSADGTSFTWSTQIGIHVVCVFLFVRCMCLDLASSVPLFFVHLLIGVLYSFRGCLWVCGNVVVSSVYVFHFLRLCFWQSKFACERIVSDESPNPGEWLIIRHHEMQPSIVHIVLVSWQDLMTVQHLYSVSSSLSSIHDGAHLVLIGANKLSLFIFVMSDSVLWDMVADWLEPRFVMQSIQVWGSLRWLLYIGTLSCFLILFLNSFSVWVFLFLSLSLC